MTPVKFSTNPVAFLRAKVAPIVPFVPRLSKRGLGAVMAVCGLVMGLDLLRVLVNFYGQAVWASVLGLLLWGIVIGAVAVAVAEYGGLFYVLRLWQQGEQAGEIALHRTTPSNLFLHAKNPVRLSLHAPFDVPDWLRMALVDSIPANTQTHQFPIHLSTPLDLNAGLLVDYELVATARGIGEFGTVWVLFFGRFGLFELYYQTQSPDESHSVRVLANVEQSLSGNLLATAHKSAVDGVLQKRRRGLGQNFHQVRSYNEGDSIRHIDWRATSRLARLMTKEYEDDQNQELLFLVDSSFRMRHQSHTDDGRGLSHLDTVLNAMLALSSLALKQGDKVGFVSFSGIDDKIIPAKKGQGVLTHLLNQSASIAPSFFMPDYLAVAKTVLGLQSKRALVVLLTTTRSEDVMELKEAVSLLSAKHLVVVASLYEESLHTVATTLPDDGDTARTYHSVQEHLGIGRAIKTELDTLAHVHAFYATPSLFPRRLIDAYVNLKRQNAIN